MSSNRPGDTIKFDHDDRQIDAGFIALGGVGDSKVASASGTERRTSELGIFGSCCGRRSSDSKRPSMPRP